MIVRYYGFYDKVSKAYVKVFPEVNDLTASRLSQSQATAIKEKDPLLVEDLETYYLFSLDNETGKITDNQVNKVFIFIDYLNQMKEAEAIKNGTRS